MDHVVNLNPFAMALSFNLDLPEYRDPTPLERALSLFGIRGNPRQIEPIRLQARIDDTEYVNELRHREGITQGFHIEIPASDGGAWKLNWLGSINKVQESDGLVTVEIIPLATFPWIA